MKTTHYNYSATHLFYPHDTSINCKGNVVQSCDYFNLGTPDQCHLIFTSKQRGKKITYKQTRTIPSRTKILSIQKIPITIASMDLLIKQKKVHIDGWHQGRRACIIQAYDNQCVKQFSLLLTINTPIPEPISFEQWKEDGQLLDLFAIHTPQKGVIKLGPNDRSCTGQCLQIVQSHRNVLFEMVEPKAKGAQ